jgi:mannose-6-phosphate isomerase-like protein (cupin superfamily)
VETNEQGASLVLPGKGKKLWVADELMTFKASGEDTGGAYSLTDSVVPPRGGPPPHIHYREDEAFWVLEGDLEVLVGENRFGAGAGSFVHLPKGVTTPTRTSAPGPPGS